MIITLSSNLLTHEISSLVLVWIFMLFSSGKLSDTATMRARLTNYNSLISYLLQVQFLIKYWESENKCHFQWEFVKCRKAVNAWWQYHHDNTVICYLEKKENKRGSSKSSVLWVHLLCKLQHSVGYTQSGFRLARCSAGSSSVELHVCSVCVLAPCTWCCPRSHQAGHKSTLQGTAQGKRQSDTGPGYAWFDLVQILVIVWLICFPLLLFLCFGS